MKVFIDFDDTIVNSTETFVSVYNELYNKNVDGKSIIYHGFKPQINLSRDEITSIFASDEFTKYLQPIHGVYKSLSELKKNGFDLYLITNCSDKSVMQKSIWFENHRQYSNLFCGKIFLSLNKPYDKSIVDMENSVLIDDHKENHKLSNASIKVAYNCYPEREWCPTEKDNVKVFNSWKKIKEYLIKTCLPKQ